MPNRKRENGEFVFVGQGWSLARVSTIHGFGLELILRARRPHFAGMTTTYRFRLVGQREAQAQCSVCLYFDHIFAQRQRSV